MSLDSTQIAKVGGLASTGLSLFNPALAFAASGATSFFASQAAADEQRELTERNTELARRVAQVNEDRQRRVDQHIQGRAMASMASSGFTARGTPIEKFAGMVAEQEENIQIERFKTRTSIQDMQIRSDYAAAQTEAAGVAGLASGMGKAGRTILTKVQPSSFFEGA